MPYGNVQFANKRYQDQSWVPISRGRARCPFWGLSRTSPAARDPKIASAAGVETAWRCRLHVLDEVLQIREIRHRCVPSMPSGQDAAANCAVQVRPPETVTARGRRLRVLARAPVVPLIERVPLPPSAVEHRLLAGDTHEPQPVGAEVRDSIWPRWPSSKATTTLPGTSQSRSLVVSERITARL